MAAPVPAPTDRDAASARLLRAAMWVAIAALVAAALICVVWVLLGGDDDIVGKAFLTVLLLAAFAGIAMLEARLAPGRPAWFVLTSMVTWVIVLLIGALFIWLPEAYDYLSFTPLSRFFKYGLVVGILALGLLHVRLYLRAHARFITPFTRITAAVTVGLVALLAILLVVPLVIEEYVDFPAIYWRIVVAIAILAAVGTALLPLVRALFGPREPRPARQAAAATPWPTYADGRTPLPVLPTGAPDWNAYYTGRPTVVAPGWGNAPAAAVGPAPAQPGFADPRLAAPTAPQPSSYGAGVPPRPAPPLPPAPTTPFAPGPSAAPDATGAPLPATSHGWWGGQQGTGGSGEPAMRWSEDAADWPTEPARRPGVRRRADS